MRSSRFLAAFAAAMALVVCSGCGGDKKESASTGAAGKAAIDVSLVTPDHFAAIVIHPRRIAQSPLVAAELKEETVAAAIKNFGIDPGEVEEIIVLYSMVKRHPGRQGQSPALAERVPTLIARFTHGVDAKEILAKLQALEDSPEAHVINEVNVGGKTCLDPGGMVMAYAPNKDTIVVAPREIMAAVVSVAEPKGPLVERLQSADAENDIIVAVEPGAFPDFDRSIDAAMKDGSPLDLKAVKKLRGGTATFSLTAPSTLRGVLDAKDAEAVDDVDDLLKQALAMARTGLALAKRTMPEDAQATYGPLVKLGEELLDGAKTTKSGSQITLEVKRPGILDTEGPAIANAMRQYVMEARAAEQQAKNLKQICLAMIILGMDQRSFPPAVIEKDGKPLLSWRVAILPGLQQTALYREFHLDEPWDSPHNLQVAKKMPSVFQSPDSPGEGKTRVMLFTGKGAAFDGGKKISAADIRDGASNTILCVEAGPDKAVPWTKPEDLPFDPEKPLAALGKVSSRGFLAGFFDGHVEQLKVDNPTLKALITPDGGEPIDWPRLRGGR